MSDQQAGILVVDDDPVFAQVLARALQARGFACRVAYNAAQALAMSDTDPPRHIVLDLKLGTESGLALIPHLKAICPHARILLLTGYASIATAVEAIKRGAHDYLAKPVDADAVASALLASERESTAHEAPLRAAPLPLRRLEWEQIQRVLADCNGNISEAARRLRMHRRTLQRKLAKRPLSEGR